MADAEDVADAEEAAASCTAVELLQYTEMARELLKSKCAPSHVLNFNSTSSSLTGVRLYSASLPCFNSVETRSKQSVCLSQDL